MTTLFFGTSSCRGGAPVPPPLALGSAGALADVVSVAPELVQGWRVVVEPVCGPGEGGGDVVRRAGEEAPDVAPDGVDSGGVGVHTDS